MNSRTGETAATPLQRDVWNLYSRTVCSYFYIFSGHVGSDDFLPCWNNWISNLRNVSKNETTRGYFVGQREWKLARKSFEDMKKNSGSTRLKVRI